MSDPVLEINAPGIDVERLVEEIRAAVAEKLKQGRYSDPRVGRAELPNLAQLKTQEEFLAFYLECLKDAVFVDINDFEILERRRFCGAALVALKRAVWKLLKFYTYRLWSQQNQVNSLLLAAVEGLAARNRDELRALEERVARLEQRAAGERRSG